jgi:hypothetical protein
MDEEEIREFRRAPTLGTLEFDYTNWQGKEHHYVVDFERGTSPGWGEVPSYEDGKMGPPVAGLSGHLILRDGDPRPELDSEGGRRRSFELSKMRNVQRVSAERLLILTQTGSVEEAVEQWDQRKRDFGGS